MAWKRGRLLLIWVVVFLLLLAGVEGLLRLVLFHFPHLGLTPVEYQPQRLDTPEAIIPPTERRSRIISPLLDNYERIRLFQRRHPRCRPLWGDLEPNLDQIWALDPDHPYRVVTNCRGLRRKSQVEDPKPPGVRRIYSLGASFTFGPYLPNQETYPALLENLLNARGGGVRYEVLNAGIPGFTLRHERELFQQRGHLSRPELVVLQVTDNDVPQYRRLRDLRLRDPEKVWPQTLGYRLRLLLRRGARYSALLRLVRWLRLRGRRAKVQHRFQTQAARVRPRYDLQAEPAGIRAPDQGMWYDPAQAEVLARCRQAYERDFAALVAFLRRRGIALLVVLFPTQEAIHHHRAGDDRVGTFYTRLTDKYRVPFLNLVPHFDRGPETRYLFLWPWNAHLSFRGNLRVARVLEPVVRRLLDPSPSAVRPRP